MDAVLTFVVKNLQPSVVALGQVIDLHNKKLDLLRNNDLDQKYAEEMETRIKDLEEARDNIQEAINKLRNL